MWLIGIDVLQYLLFFVFLKATYVLYVDWKAGLNGITKGALLSSIGLSLIFLWSCVNLTLKAFDIPWYIPIKEPSKFFISLYTFLSLMYLIFKTTNDDDNDKTKSDNKDNQKNSSELLQS